MEDSAASSFLFKTAVTLRINYTVQWTPENQISQEKIQNVWNWNLMWNYIILMFFWAFLSPSMQMP
jgi:hypothetical protein